MSVRGVARRWWRSARGRGARRVRRNVPPAAEAGASRRERIVLYGIVPVLCAVLGAVLTVIAGRLFGGDHPTGLVAAVMGSAELTPIEKATLLDLATRDDQIFYDFLRTWLFLLSAPLGVIAWAVADWIRTR